MINPGPEIDDFVVCTFDQGSLINLTRSARGEQGNCVLRVIDTIPNDESSGSYFSKLCHVYHSSATTSRFLGKMGFFDYEAISHRLTI